MAVVKKITDGVLYSCGYKFVPYIAMDIKKEDAEYIKKTFPRDFEIENNSTEDKSEKKTGRGKSKKQE